MIKKKQTDELLKLDHLPFGQLVLKFSNGLIIFTYFCGCVCCRVKEYDSLNKKKILRKINFKHMFYDDDWLMVQHKIHSKEGILFKFLCLILRSPKRKKCSSYF